MSSESLTTWQIFVSGKVQGVSYRRFAQKAAIENGLQGWTRNLKDSRVEVMAQGTSRQLEKFLSQLKQGPAFGRVDEVKVETVSAQNFRGFEIAQDGE